MGDRSAVPDQRHTVIRLPRILFIQRAYLEKGPYAGTVEANWGLVGFNKPGKPGYLFFHPDNDYKGFFLQHERKGILLRLAISSADQMVAVSSAAGYRHLCL